MTDPGFADRTYLEPLDLEGVAAVIERERPDAVLPTMGGQTALNLARSLAEADLLFERRADRRPAGRHPARRGSRALPGGCAQHRPRRARVADRHRLGELGGIKLPAVIRPAFTLGGHGGGFVSSALDLHRQVEIGLDESPIDQVLVEESVRGWDEFELEVVRDAKDNVVIVCSIENLDPMGVHTGDSVTVAPQMTLSDEAYQELRDAAAAVIRAVGVECGGSNIQFAR